MDVQLPNPEREGTPRAIAAGLAVGALLAVANLYVGLSVGFWDSGHVTAAVLAYALLSALGRAHGRRETIFALTVAVAAGAMPAVTGLLGPIPALAQLASRAAPSAAGASLWAAAARPSAALLAGWGAALGLLGVLLALLLRRRLIEDENLPFPSGIATAELVSAMHAGGTSSGKARALLIAAALAAAFTWLRDGKLAWIPGLIAIPGALGPTSLASLTAGVGMSPLLAGIGALIGLRVASALLFGSLAAWLLIVPALLRAGATADSAAAFVVWPAVALLVGAAAVSLGKLLRTFGAGARDLAASSSQAARDLSASSNAGRPGAADVPASSAAARSDSRAAAILFAASAAAVLVLGVLLFDLPLLHGLLALAASIPLAALCGRSAGQTDVSPAGQVSQLTQAAFAPLVRGRAALDIGAAAVVSGTSAQTGVTLWSLKAGHLLGSAVRGQAVAALIGSGFGAVLSGAAYAVLFRGNALPKFAMPNAQQWKAFAELTASGAQAMPDGAGKAAAAALAIGALLQILADTKAGRYLPDPTALGIGMLLPIHAAAAAFVGAGASAVWQKARPESHVALGNVVAGGLVAGESVAGLAVAVADVVSKAT